MQWYATQNDIEKRGLQGEFRLSNGLCVPVSRSRWRDVAKAVDEWRSIHA